MNVFHTPREAVSKVFIRRAELPPSGHVALSH